MPTRSSKYNICPWWCAAALLLGGGLWPVRAVALTPPWSEAELRAGATAVVDGTVGTQVTCTGKREKAKCADTARYAVPLTVTKVHQSKVPLEPGAVLTLHFWHKSYKRGCAGDQAHTHLPGETGTYSLQRRADGTWHQIHWSGVRVHKAGSGHLPSCK